MDGSKMGYRYEVLNDWIREGGFRGLDFFDQLERLQVIELETLRLETKAREIERGNADARKKFKGATDEDLPRHHGPKKR